ncbi:MAG: TlpA family protein disulfide reductase [Chloroflexia bacterium]
MDKRWIPVAVAAVAVVLVLGLLASILLVPSAGGPQAGAHPAGGNPNVEAMRIGYLAPDFTLDSLAGGKLQLSSLRGAHPVWVNFWTTWCGYCKVEMPEMAQLYSANKDKGLEILGVDDQEPPSSVQRYLQGRGFSWNFLLDANGLVSNRYQLRGLPTHIFIGRDGVIQDVVVGGIERRQMETEVAKLLGNN